MKRYFFNPSKKQKYLIACFDVVLITLAIIASYCLRIYFTTGTVSFDIVIGKIKLGHSLIIPIHMFTLYALNLYSLRKIVNPAQVSIKIIISVILAAMLISGSLFFFPKYVFGRQVFIIHIILLSFLLVLSRLAVLKIFGIFKTKKRVALVCSKKIADMFVDELSKRKFKGVRVTHILYVDGQNECGAENQSQKDIVFCSSLADLLNGNQFDILGFDSSNVAFSNQEIQLLLEIKQKNKDVYDIPNLYKNLTGKIPLEYIDGPWLLNRDDFQGGVSRSYLQLKRVFDITGAILFIILFSPFMCMIAAAIKFESKGNIVFSQERLGLNRKPFICYKFRTMVENAEGVSGPVWAKDGDNRITKVGMFLRKSRLDELPQLWNIFKGDISFVGPRPIRKYFADELSKKIPFYELRFSVKPGLSGWAQVNLDYAGSDDGQHEKFQYELFYIQNMSLILDFITIFKTVQSVLKVEGK
jgi:exopolysaccharide biosynthesis polyprenyl glycosylphosphotransferase